MSVRLIGGENELLVVGSSKKGPAPEITLSPDTLPGGIAWEAYGPIMISAAGGNEPYKFSLTAGEMPAGISLDVDGKLQGTPTEGGSFSITVTATDRRRYTGSRQYTITVAIPDITISPATIPVGNRGQAFTATQFSASGATAPYKFEIVDGVLPDGLMFVDGLLSGTPEQIGTFPFTLRATDAHGLSGQHGYSLVINALTVTVNPATLPGGVTGTAYSQALSATGGVGTYTFEVSSGVLPTGLSMDVTGAISGTPTVADDFTFTVSAMDSYGNSGSRQYAVAVRVPEIVKTLTSFNNVTDSDIVEGYFTPAEWQSPNTKRFIIASGVEINAIYGKGLATSVSPFGGRLIVENHGVISGPQGVANGGTGGIGLVVPHLGAAGNRVELINRGIIRGGGGGGGKGGAGGGGYYDTPQTVRDPASGDLGAAGQYQWYANANAVKIWWGGAVIYDGMPGAVTQIDVGGWTYFKGATFGPSAFRIWRQQTTYNRTYTNGGAGGDGGRGQGAPSGWSAGIGGAAGGTNAGRGGAGGNGGDWGQNGVAGATGSAGNNGAGAAGSPGGVAGAAISGVDQLTIVENTGQIIGRTE